MAMYYAQHAFAKGHNGTFTANVTELAAFARPDGALDGLCTRVPDIVLLDNHAGFLATIRGLGDSEHRRATITDRRLLHVV
jgi:aminoglycoside/choline kinase family phosphotransferase